MTSFQNSSRFAARDAKRVAGRLRRPAGVLAPRWIVAVAVVSVSLVMLVLSNSAFSLITLVVGMCVIGILGNSL